jgi:hypothetical protein
MLIVATEHTKGACVIDPGDIIDVSDSDVPNHCTVKLFNRTVVVDIPRHEVESIVLGREAYEAHRTKMMGYGDRPPKDIKT